ncbi:TPA: anti-phage deoxyguanosine triphosphatase, partial [Legionella pneumophila]
MDSINWHTFRFELEIEKNLDHRTPFEKDKCKVVHSYSFRRLQGKIQIVSGKDSDFHRNRLTHSIEVASIAKSIFNNLLYRLQQDKKKNLEDKLIFLNSQKNEDIDTLLDTIGLLHDIGHPPYGHGGEQALNYKMRNYGGFEGNAQTLRLINKVDSLNLTYRTLLGVLKYPATYSALVNVKTYPNLDQRISDQKEITEYLIDNSRWNPPKCYYDSDNPTVLNLLSYITDNERIEFQRSFPAPKPDHKKTKYKTFDCSVMNIADDISYSIHDLEDAIFFRQISMDELVNFFENQNFIQNWSNYPTLLLSDDLKARKKVIGTLIHEAIIHTCIEENSNFNEPIFRYFVKFEN